MKTAQVIIVSSVLVATCLATGLGVNAQNITSTLTKNENATTPNSGSLRFAAGPADGFNLILERLFNLERLSIRVDKPNYDPSTLVPRPPIAEYSLDFRDITGGGGLETAQISGFYYLAEAAGKPVFSGELPVGAKIGNFNTSVNDAETVARALDRLAQLTASDPLRGRTYAVRLIFVHGSPDPPFELMAFWLKADAGGADLIYPVSFTVYGPYHKRTNTLRLNQLNTPADFVAAIRPFLQWTSDTGMNDYYVTDFVSLEGQGSGRMTSHHMDARKSMFEMLDDHAPMDGAMPSAKTYEIDSVELIGIAMHNPPVAYDRSMIVNNQTTATVHNIRPLTDFETKSLDVLRGGQDATAMPTDNGGRIVVGAIRAQQGCLDCHSGKKVGDLLGAFSYRLSPVNLPGTGKPVANQ